MTFKFKEVNGRFIHTMCEGELMKRLTESPQVGKELKDFCPPELAARKESFYRRAWQGEENVLYEGELNGITYLASLKPIKRDGAVIEVIASCVDITEKKNAEEKLRTTQELLESLLQNTSDAVDLIDSEGKVIWVNKAFATIFGWSDEEIVGKNLPIFPDDLEREFQMILKKLLAGEHITGLETVRKRKDGSLIDISLTASPIRNKEGKIVAYSGISRDITERKKTEELLRKSDKLSVVGQLAAGLAHEIRNPLTALRGFLQLLKGGRAEKQDYYEIMLSELDRINFIVSELLLIAKPEKVAFEAKDLTAILKSVVDLFNTHAIINNVTIHTEFADQLPEIPCSEMQLKQVFINILKNALESMPNGGDIIIRTRLSDQKKIVITVTDQGCGIPEDRISSLGEPFYSTKIRGTGLGLMMCFKIIESHRGRIQFHSQLNKGTMVEVMLPTADGTGFGLA
jgi:PAS domain S-box-containing protein